MKESELRIGFLISGGGTTAEAVIEACQKGKLLKVKPIAVIASRPDSPGIEKAHRLGVKTIIVQRKDFPTAEGFDEELLAILKNLKVDLISQNGWLVKTPPNVIEEYRGKIINQHPGPLDPGRSDFGGKGMYGGRVTCARLVYEWLCNERHPWTESTVHFVNKEYDQGDLIRVVKMAIPSSIFPLVTTTRQVQAQLLPLEHKNVIATLQSFAEEKIPKFKRSQPLTPEGKEFIVDLAKQLAIKLFPKG